MNEKKQQSSRIGMRIMVGLLTLVMLITVCMPGLAVKANAEDTGLDDTQQAAPTLATRTVTASVNGLDFSVTGQFTETTELNVQALGSNEADYIRDSVLNLDEQIVGSAYDITLYDNGIEIQPGEDVEVSISGITAAESVYHLSHTSAADVQKLTAEKTDRKAGAVLKHEKVDFRQEQGRLKFKANGFSVFYIATGMQSVTDDGWSSNDDIIYMAPGTKAQITLLNDYGNLATCESKVEGSGSITAEISGNNNKVVTISVSENAKVGDTAVVTSSYNVFGITGGGSVTVKVVSKADAESAILEAEKAEIVDKLDKQGYPVWVAVRDDGNIPTEPSDQSAYTYKYYYYKSNGEIGSGEYANTADGIISPDIVNHERFSNSTDGSPTVGLYDGDGSDTLAVLTATIDFDDFLYELAGQNAAHASNGTVVNRDNYQNYKIIPYVVKMQEENGRGWHIDCVVVPRNYVTLQYNINFPRDFTTVGQNIYLPYSENGEAPAPFIVGSIKGLTNNSTVQVTDSAGGTYTFTFKGWNTEPSGQGDPYDPDDSITINENTTLYAIWDSNPAVGTGNLQITKQVKGTATDGETFDFNVTLKDKDGKTLTEAYNYKVYDSSNIEVFGKGGTITGGSGTIALEATQHATILNLPDKAVVTITENTSGYTPTWSISGTADDPASSTVTIKGGTTTQVTCTNTPVPKTADVTITKRVEGNMGDLNKEFEFTVNINGNTKVNVITYDKYTLDGSGNEVFSSRGRSFTNGDTVTLKHGQYIKFNNVPFDATLTVTEENVADGTYTMTADQGTVNDSTLTYKVTSADDVTIIVTNTYNANIDTGVLLDTIPYVLILGVVAVGAVLLLKKRRNRDDV